MSFLIVKNSAIPYTFVTSAIARGTLATPAQPRKNEVQIDGEDLSPNPQRTDKLSNRSHGQDLSFGPAYLITSALVGSTMCSKPVRFVGEKERGEALRTAYRPSVQINRSLLLQPDDILGPTEPQLRTGLVRR